MRRHSPQSPRRTSLALALSAVILLAAASACARPASVSQADPEIAPEDDAQVQAVVAEDEAQEQAVASEDDAEGLPDASSGEVTKRREEPLESLFAGRTTGLRVVKNQDGSLSIRVHGPTSFMLNNEPLYILDGSPFVPGPNGTLSGLNPRDVESIEVLKDPAAITRWGVRASNGVIIITTTRPMK